MGQKGIQMGNDCEWFDLGRLAVSVSGSHSVIQSACSMIEHKHFAN